ncbi:MAG: hypothetical protein A2Y64_08745 [Candidatus Coatesbacteria bacterium RBG_13_66_14]|uniref:Uncharacterized protein n=1 Tax=Candidatus Coatesbacteria bacterium RBG_13_66_14 TaxID=1817816 RepID=A0A1F5FB85_9BACT|nr:MAG: hypothetical protein A2Y64_08745 [Candidatus Coatesbacteria bacterium RBG_13_66_14]
MKTADWLMAGPAFVRHRTLTDLLQGVVEMDDEDGLRREMLADPLVARLVAEVNAWEGQPPLKRHNDAAHPLHKLVFLAELGVGRGTLAPAVESILAHQSPDGPFQIKAVIPKAYGGDDAEHWTWFACDAPLTGYALVRLGLGNDERVRRSIAYIYSRIEEHGSPCHADPFCNPKFRGPGRKGDPCPYACLLALRLFSAVPEMAESAAADRLVEMLLGHWAERGSKKYYLFGVGSDFAKLKAPRVWYDILHFADTLSRFTRARYDERFGEVIETLRSKADGLGRFTPESVWLNWNPDGKISKPPAKGIVFYEGQPVGDDPANWSGWEFCQKREPSRWLTCLAWGIMGRAHLPINR